MQSQPRKRSQLLPTLRKGAGFHSQYATHVRYAVKRAGQESAAQERQPATFNKRGLGHAAGWGQNWSRSTSSGCRWEA